MDLRSLMNNLDVAKLMATDKKVWRATLRCGDTVPANSGKPTTLSISSRGLFLLCSITGRFSTLKTGPVDDGVCRLSFSMTNGSGRVYIQDPIYMDSFLTPGRVKDGQDPDGEPSGVLQFPGIEFLTLFQPTDEITFVVDNAADFANSWQYQFHGFWVK